MIRTVKSGKKILVLSKYKKKPITTITVEMQQDLEEVFTVKRLNFEKFYAIQTCKIKSSSMTGILNIREEYKLEIEKLNYMNSIQRERKIKLEVLNFPKWKKNSTCYIFSVRPDNVDPDYGAPNWTIDTWVKADYGDIKGTERSVFAIKLRSRYNMSHVYAVWLPDELASDIDKKNNPEDYMELIMKYKFSI